jgi:hypothetical protein
MSLAESSSRDRRPRPRRTGTKDPGSAYLVPCQLNPDEERVRSIQLPEEEP